MDYKKLFNAYNKYSEYNINYDDLQKQFNKSLLLAYKNEFGKKTTSVNKAITTLPEDMVSQLRDPYQNILNERINKRKQIKENMKNLLEEYAKDHNVVASNNMCCIKKSDGGNYHTQGFGCNKYAKGSLKESQMLLDLFGYKTEIKEIRGESADRWGIRYNKYELWTNLTLFDYYCFKEQGNFISVLNWAVLCWRNGVNPKVYFPFLSDEDYEKSLKLWRDPNYKITKDNCMLEISMEEISNES